VARRSCWFESLRSVGADCVLAPAAAAACFLHCSCKTNRAKASRISAAMAAEAADAGRWWRPWDWRSATTAVAVAAAGGEDVLGGGEIFN
jgi:hypothetical protein